MVTTFEGLWPTLGLAGNTAVDQTIRPRTIVGHTSIAEVPRAEPLAPSTLPHLSIGGLLGIIGLGWRTLSPTGAPPLA